MITNDPNSLKWSKKIPNDTKWSQNVPNDDLTSIVVCSFSYTKLNLLKPRKTKNRLKRDSGFILELELIAKASFLSCLSCVSDCVSDCVSNCVSDCVSDFVSE